jgi:hypothetical protein
MDENVEHYKSALEDQKKELAKVQKDAKDQFDRNIENSFKSDDHSITAMLAKTLIHIGKARELTKEECQQKLVNIYNFINDTEFGSNLLYILAQCENLQILFDFESNQVSFNIY